MPERLEFELSARDKASGQMRNVEKEVQRLNKTVAAGAKGSKAAAASLKQLRQAADLLGKELAGDVAPSVKRATGELRNMERQAGATTRSMRGVDRQMGLSASKANAFTRAATRGVAAIGFISPTAATASAQLVGLTNASAAATVAIGASAVGAIALGTALVASSKAAISFESSFRGIRKTVEATEEEYASLEAQNRKLARSLGESVNTINDVGKAAGQLGIAIGDIAQFERIIVELVSATDLVAASASLSLGGLRAVLSLTIEDLDRLTDQLVALGNQFAATEPEIVGLFQRIAGAGAVLKIPAQDLLSIATAFAHVRVQQEAAGTAIQKVFLAIQRAAIVGGDDLRSFARILGVTTQEFQNMARTDPTAAFVGFVDALSRSGEKAQLLLEELGLTDQRLRRTFLKMAAAQGVLTSAIDEGSEAYQEGTARTEEHEKALDTTAGQLRLAKAAFTDMAISVGQTVTPAIRDAAEVAVVFADAMETMGVGVSAVTDKLTFLHLSLIDLIPGLRNAQAAVQFLSGNISGGVSTLTPGWFDALANLGGETNIRGIIDDINTLRMTIDEVQVSVDSANASMASAGTAIRDLDSAAEKAKGHNALKDEILAVEDALDAVAFAVKGFNEAPGPEKLTLHLKRIVANATLADEAAQALNDAIQGLGEAEVGDLGLDNLSNELDGLTEDANKARDAIFAVFKAPTLAEEKAKLAVLELKRELLELQTKPGRFTEAEREQEAVLKRRISSGQRLADIERNRSEIAASRLRIEEGALLTHEEQLSVSRELVEELAALNVNMATFVGQTADAVKNLDPAWDLMKRLVAESDALTKTKFKVFVETVGIDAARKTLRDFMQWGGEMTAEDFVVTLRVFADTSELDTAITKILTLAKVSQEARTAISFGALELDAAAMTELASSLATGFRAVEEDAASFGKTVEKAAKKVKEIALVDLPAVGFDELVQIMRDIERMDFTTIGDQLKFVQALIDQAAAAFDNAADALARIAGVDTRGLLIRLGVIDELQELNVAADILAMQLGMTRAEVLALVSPVVELGEAEEEAARRTVKFTETLADQLSTVRDSISAYTELSGVTRDQLMDVLEELGIITIPMLGDAAQQLAQDLELDISTAIDLSVALDAVDTSAAETTARLLSLVDAAKGLSSIFALSQDQMQDVLRDFPLIADAFDQIEADKFNQLAQDLFAAGVPIGIIIDFIVALDEAAQDAGMSIEDAIGGLGRTLGLTQEQLEEIIADIPGLAGIFEQLRADKILEFAQAMVDAGASIADVQAFIIAAGEALAEVNQSIEDFTSNVASFFGLSAEEVEKYLRQFPELAAAFDEADRVQETAMREWLATMGLTADQIDRVIAGLHEMAAAAKEITLEGITADLEEAIRNIMSGISSLLRMPTIESTQARIQRLLLERERAQLEGEGTTSSGRTNLRAVLETFLRGVPSDAETLAAARRLEAIDEELELLRKAEEDRQFELEMLELQALLASDTLLTNQEMLVEYERQVALMAEGNAILDDLAAGIVTPLEAALEAIEAGIIEMTDAIVAAIEAAPPIIILPPDPRGGPGALPVPNPLRLSAGTPAPNVNQTINVNVEDRTPSAYAHALEMAGLRMGKQYRMEEF